MDINKPQQYIDKECTFLGRNFYIDEGAHIPRQSTEYIAEYYINSINNLIANDLTVADIGTGTGVLAISIALGCTKTGKIYATDLFDSAIQVAKKNIAKYNLAGKVEIEKGNLFEPLLDKKIDVIIANLPFASDEKMQQLRPEVIKFEPLSGIHGGETGFELYDRLFDQIKNYKYFKDLKGIWIYCNIEHEQKVKRVHKELLKTFNLKTITDKYKPYYLHCYFYKEQV